jgi:hypothetical protein
MKFELEPNSRDITKEALLADIGHAAKCAGSSALTIKQYDKYGKYPASLARQRCGSWLQAVAEAGLCTKRKNSKAPSHEFTPDLVRVAAVLGKPTVTQAEYRALGHFGSAVISRHFGGWLKALRAAGLQQTREYMVPDEEYLKNIEAMWTHLGRQPHYGEVHRPLSKYSAGAYERRFGSWRKALQRFVTTVAQERGEDSPDQQPTHTQSAASATPDINQQRPKSISWRLRFLVMRRDDFKCRFCGRSPAFVPGLQLHVDHVHPSSKGGPSTLENLQTLCQQCNIGKSDLPAPVTDPPGSH